MKIQLNAPEDLEVSELTEPDMQIDSRSEETHFSAMEMFATSLAICTASVMIAYAQRIAASTEGLSVRMRWSYSEQPFRIGDITMDIHWPGLPESRLKAAQRAAAQCTLHNTLEHPPRVETRVNA